METAWPAKRLAREIARRTVRRIARGKGYIGAAVAIPLPLGLLPLSTVQHPALPAQHSAPGATAPTPVAALPSGPAPSTSTVPKAPAAPALFPSSSGPGVVWGMSCYNPQDATGSYVSSNYVYGATNVNAEAGNSSLTVEESASGTVTVMRAAAANYDNQVNYFATGYDPTTGRAIAARPNAGSFLGIRWTTGSAPAAQAHFAWLRNWHHSQRFLTSTTPVPVTTYVAPASVGLRVVDTDLATAGSLHALDGLVPAGGPDAFVRDVTVTRSASSPVTSAELVAYGNFSPIASDVPYVPFEDAGCATQANTTKVGHYSRSDRVATISWSGVDMTTGKPASATVAVGFAGPTTGFEVGTDSYDPLAPPGPEDGYQELASTPYELGGSRAALGQVTVALEAPLDFTKLARPSEGSGAGSVAAARLIVSEASTPRAATEQLDFARHQSFSSELRAVTRAWRSLFEHVPLPKGAGKRVLYVTKRSVITMLLAVDPQTWAIVASPDTQGPYGEDWIRDGSFINAALDEDGFTWIVTRHDLFYARTQSSPTNPLPGVPFGNWPMNMYVTGQPGGPIPWEIDETGYGVWTLARQARFVPARQRLSYLHKVFPAIARGAEWLTLCMDPTNGFQCPASEDDNFTPSQTLHGALPDLLALRSAVQAAGELHKSGPEVKSWAARSRSLEAAIDSLYDPAQDAYREEPSSTSALPVSYEDGGLLLWPTHLHRYSSASMQGEAAATYSSMESSFQTNSGLYEGVALLGLCHAWKSAEPAQLAELRSTLSYMASALTTNTGLFGEGWLRWGDGATGPLNDQPHTWEHALFDMSALCLS